jgi:hypothetical protein
LSQILRHGEDGRLRDFGANVIAQIAVHRLPDIVVVLEGEADARDARDGNEGRQDQRRQVEELDGP